MHSHASSSRSGALLVAYIMRTHEKSAVDAAAAIVPKWSALWPNETFVQQLIAYEGDLQRERLQL